MNKTKITLSSLRNETYAEKSCSLESRSPVPKGRVWWIKRQRTCKCYEKIYVFWQTNSLILFKLAKVSNLASTAQWINSYCYKVLTFPHSINARPEKLSSKKKSFTEKLGKVIFILQLFLNIKKYTDLEVLEHTHTHTPQAETHFLLPSKFAASKGFRSSSFHCWLDPREIQFILHCLPQVR